MYCVRSLVYFTSLDRFIVGMFIYSMWSGYRSSDYQKSFEDFLIRAGFSVNELHTSGHAFVSDICHMISGLRPRKIIQVLTTIGLPQGHTQFHVKRENAGISTNLCTRFLLDLHRFKRKS